MKVTVASVASIDARRLIYQQEVARIAMQIAGKTTLLEIESEKTVGELVSAASAAFAFPESLNISSAYMVIGETPIEDTRTLADVGVQEDSPVQIRFVVIVL